MSFQGGSVKFEDDSLQDIAFRNISRRAHILARSWYNRQSSETRSQQQYVLETMQSENPRVSPYIVEEVFRSIFKRKKKRTPLAPLKEKKQQKPPRPPPGAGGSFALQTIR